MAVRIRMDNKTIICAAKSEAIAGDLYVDDNLHYALAVNMRVLSVCGLTVTGAELWEFHAPITWDEKMAKEEKAKVNIVNV